MQEFNELTYTTAEQHKAVKISKIERNIEKNMQNCSPFSVDFTLRNGFGGIVANKYVNVHVYESVGKNVVHRMLRTYVFSVAFKIIYKAKTFSSS